MRALCIVAIVISGGVNCERAINSIKLVEVSTVKHPVRGVDGRHDCSFTVGISDGTHVFHQPSEQGASGGW